jgi:hypothetical protein
MAVYNYDSNAILTAPITSRNEMITIQPRQTKTKTKTRNASSNVPYIIRGEWNIQILCSMGGGVVVRVLHTRRTTIVPYVLRKLQPDRDVMGGETRSAKCGQERRYSEEMRDDETMSRHTTRIPCQRHGTLSAQRCLLLIGQQSASRAGGHFFLSDTPSDPKQAARIQPTRNGPVHTTCQIMRNVLASAAEAEIGALFLNKLNQTRA